MLENKAGARLIFCHFELWHISRHHKYKNLWILIFQIIFKNDLSYIDILFLNKYLRSYIDILFLNEYLRSNTALKIILSVYFCQKYTNLRGQNSHELLKIKKKNTLTSSNIHSLTQNDWKWRYYEVITSCLCLIITENDS